MMKIRCTDRKKNVDLPGQKGGIVNRIPSLPSKRGDPRIVMLFSICILTFFCSLIAHGKTVKVRQRVTKKGTYVHGHARTSPNRTTSDNWSKKGNMNPYTGKRGTKK